MATMPPLKWLATFRVAAMHLSFTEAARILSLRQPAVSRQVAALEAHIGRPLFMRTKPKLTLTEAGARLYAVLNDSFAQIEHVLQALQPVAHNRALVVSTPIGFASCFLMPRLAEFAWRQPDVEVRLLTRDQNLAYDERQADVVIVFADGALPGVYQQMIFPEELVAVCHPHWRERWATPTLELPELLQQPLLHLNSPTFRGDWQRFVAGTGVSVPEAQARHSYNSFMVYLQATLNGDGIALGWSQLMRSRLRTGELCLACERRVHSVRGYFACVTPRAEHDAAARAFVDWASGLEGVSPSTR